MADPTPVDRNRIPSLAPVPFPDRDRARPHLPKPLTRFVGREREVTAVVDLLRRPGVRLVTLTGPGGVGKTRLAIRVAEDVAGDYPGGLWFVPLAPVRDATFLPALVAETLGLQELASHTPDEALREHLLDRRALLVLDNLEQLAEAPPFIAAWLAACPSLTILATSRTLLRLSTERAFPVPPLGLPSGAATAPADSDAVRLFAERAAVAKPGFALDLTTAAPIAGICRRLDGLPLAIELAAARVRHLPPAALLTRLDAALPLLTGGARDAPERHQTMRAALAWSHDLLTAEERGLFRKLAVFAGGFTVEAAEALADDAARTLDLLGALVDQSLVLTLDAQHGGARFRLLEPVREFASELLEAAGETEAVRARSAAHFASLADRYTVALIEQDAADRSWFRAEIDNLRAALAWAAERDDPVVGLRLAAAMAPDFIDRGHLAEGVRWLEYFLGRDHNAPPRLYAFALNWLALALQLQGEIEHAGVAIERALPLARASGDDRLVALILIWLGHLDLDRGNDDLAASRYEEVRAMAGRIGDQRGLALAISSLGYLAHLRRDFATAIPLSTESLTIARRIGEPALQAQLLTQLAFAARRTGAAAQAARFLLESLELLRAEDFQLDLPPLILGGAEAALDADAPQTAARLFGAATKLQTALGAFVPAFQQSQFDEVEAAARPSLGDAGFAAACEEGRALTLADALAQTEAILIRLAETADQPTATAPAPKPDHDLTPRELDVLRLLAADRTNLQIAEALFISEHTVRKHVERILSKLAVDSRAGAAAWAVRHDLA